MGCGASVRNISEEKVISPVLPDQVQAFEEPSQTLIEPVQIQENHHQLLKKSYEASVAKNPNFFYNEEILMAEIMHQSIIDDQTSKQQDHLFHQQLEEAQQDSKYEFDKHRRDTKEIEIQNLAQQNPEFLANRAQELIKNSSTMAIQEKSKKKLPPLTIMNTHMDTAVELSQMKIKEWKQKTIVDSTKETSIIKQNISTSVIHSQRVTDPNFATEEAFTPHMIRKEVQNQQYQEKSQKNLNPMDELWNDEISDQKQNQKNTSHIKIAEDFSEGDSIFKEIGVDLPIKTDTTRQPKTQYATKLASQASSDQNEWGYQNTLSGRVDSVKYNKKADIVGQLAMRIDQEDMEKGEDSFADLSFIDEIALKKQEKKKKNTDDDPTEINAFDALINDFVDEEDFLL